MTSAILGPSTALLGRLRYAWKFAFIALILVVPLAAVTGAYGRLQGRQVTFSEKERVGLAYMTPLLTLARVQLGARAPRTHGEAPGLAEAMMEVEAVDRRHGATLGVRAEWTHAANLLAVASRGGGSASPAERSANTALLALIVRVGDASNLTLDPDLDTYYLMDALQFRLPAMLAATHRLVSAGGPGRRELGAAVDTGALLGALRSDMAALSRGLGTTVRTTRSTTLRRRIPVQLRGMRTDTAEFDSRIVDSIRGPAGSRAPPDAAAEALTSRISALIDLTAPQLDALLAVRIEGLRHNTQQITLLALASTLLAAYLFVGFYRSVGSPVRAMVAALQAVGDGDFTQTVTVGTRDELHQIAEAINHTIARTRGVTDRLARQATHDELTGLPNRALILDRLQRALGRVQRRGERVAVLFIDLDRFKLINDRGGHEAGDEVLCTVARRLSEVVRATDTVGRLAGDEFVVVCEDLADVEAGLVIARRVADALETPITVQGRTAVSIGASVGIAFAQLGRACDPEDLIRDADAAMYLAKDLGRGRVEIFDAVLRASVAGRAALQDELLHAIETDELVLHYQPISDVHTGRATCVEALVRWNHPRRGLLGPGEFVPLAEETGNIVPLGAWVLRTACRQLASWLSAYPELAALTISVNLSVGELSDPRLVARVADSLIEAGLEPSSLCLELTESAMMKEPESARQTLEALSALGVSLAVDDFGSGYSSLSYLRDLPVQSLKIDRSFIARLQGGREDEAIVGLVAGLGEALGLEVVAEGVETDRQLADVRRLGCDKAQGFLLGRPVASSEIEARLRADRRPIPAT